MWVDSHHIGVLNLDPPAELTCLSLRYHDVLSFKLKKSFLVVYSCLLYILKSHIVFFMFSSYFLCVIWLFLDVMVWPRYTLSPKSTPKGVMMSHRRYCLLHLQKCLVRVYSINLANLLWILKHINLFFDNLRNEIINL